MSNPNLESTIPEILGPKRMRRSWMLCRSQLSG